MKFIIFQSSWDTTNALFEDLYFEDDTIMYKTIWKNGFFDAICRSHLFGKLSIFPFKYIWKYLANVNKLPNDNYVFIYIGSQVASTAAYSGLIDRLRTKYRNSKHISYYIDIHAMRSLDMVFLKDIFDLSYIFDEEEAKTMGLKYYPIPFSSGKFSDIAFVGQAKGRHEELVKIYNKVTPYGVKCAFYIIGVPKEEQVEKEGIVYGPLIDHNASMKYIWNTNCILELKVNDVQSYSDRVQKAIAYNKKILTNNHNIKNNPFYSAKMMQIYESIDEIDVNFIKDSVNKYSYNYNGEYSPSNFLKKIKQDLLYECEDKLAE